MSIVATELADVHGSPKTYVFRCQDSTGAWHQYQVISSDPAFDPEAYKPTVAAKVQGALEEREFNQVIG